MGHNLDAEGLCPEAIQAQLAHDIAKVTSALDRSLPDWRGHPPEVQRVLINLGFNLGVPGLLRFRTTLALINAGQYADAADSLLSNKRFHKQVGERLDRLAKLLRSVV